MCNNCIHKAVCSIYRATGGVKKCEHFKEERKGKWVNIMCYEDGNCYGFCSVCAAEQKAQNPSALRAFHGYCRWCGADMRGAEDGK